MRSLKLNKYGILFLINCLEEKNDIYAITKRALVLLYHAYNEVEQKEKNEASMQTEDSSDKDVFFTLKVPKVIFEYIHDFILEGKFPLHNNDLQMYISICEEFEN